MAQPSRAAPPRSSPRSNSRACRSRLASAQRRAGEGRSNAGERNNRVCPDRDGQGASVRHDACRRCLEIRRRSTTLGANLDGVLSDGEAAWIRAQRTPLIHNRLPAEPHGAFLKELGRGVLSGRKIGAQSGPIDWFTEAGAHRVPRPSFSMRISNASVFPRLSSGATSNGESTVMSTARAALSWITRR